MSRDVTVAELMTNLVKVSEDVIHKMRSMGAEVISAQFFDGTRIQFFVRDEEICVNLKKIEKSS